METLKSSFLHACINHGVLKLNFAEKVLSKICKENKVDKPADIRAFVAEIDEEITKYGQTLVFQEFPITGGDYVVFGVISELPVDKMIPTLTEDERKYFGVLLERIVYDDDFRMPWHLGYNLDDVEHLSIKNLTKQRMSELLEIWVLQGYFYEENDSIFFGPRMIVEFGYYLRKHYPDFIKECPLCKKLVFWDVNCPSCKVKIHVRCLRKYLRTRSECPTCKATWTTPLDCESR